MTTKYKDHDRDHSALNTNRKSRARAIELFSNVLPLFTDLVKLVKLQCKEAWQEYFDERSREKGIWYRTIQPQISSHPWIDNIKANRGFLKTVLRLRSGHIPSNKFAFLMKKSPSPNCSDCGTIDDVQHVLMECVRNQRYRQSCITMIRSTDIGLLNNILADPTSEMMKVLVKLAELGLK